MAITLIIISCLLWIGAIILLPRKALYSPALAYLGLFAISFAQKEGIYYIPLNNTILVTWLCMSIIVMLATLMQPEPLKNSTQGVGYIIGGGLAGMIVGLLGFTFSTSLPLLYGIMVVATVAGIFFGFLMYTNTPRGVGLSLQSGNFFRYLLAKGFPTAITMMQIGIVLVIVLALYNRPITV
ncbi:MAG: hypothetical protein NC097_08225 [Clostridium sp.]|nr:hypothetical protein [Prevotella sp.]MCM1429761.1 hypothetical protein [Clostridium sp.]MCM1474924.1 hypothetical protein [Muribaculaceae bacterium]